MLYLIALFSDERRGSDDTVGGQRTAYTFAFKMFDCFNHSIWTQVEKTALNIFKS